MIQRKFKSWMLISLFILMLPIAAAVNFNVNCPASSSPGQSFTCQVNMPIPPASGLSSLSFTANAGGAAITVTFPQGTMVSSGGTYGFFLTSPLTTSDSFATMQVTPTNAQTLVTLQLIGVRGRLGDNTLLLPLNPAPNNIVFNNPVITVDTASVCTIGQYRCSAGAREQCNAAGSAWTAAACPSGSQCTGSGVCARTCTEADWCSAWGACAGGTQTRTCNAPSGAACTAGGLPP